ncbi:putative beta-primeverosidase [Medicago truncatula]|uniref:Putative beta-primeverosidase n=1 Tax=Medicago truncatula TaxID=3880 RepID=G7KKU1_MEDTR|nr:uncharacterized protein LOC11420200 isoform X1 [Medicago truncatula]AES76437.1 transmembrane protein, putative [Medicago truncatula]RHN52593.1 putative beta-primeverosidase [Medicago truncatula]
MALNILLLSGVVVILRYVVISSFLECLISGKASSAYQYEGAANVVGRGPRIWHNSTHNYPGQLHYYTDSFPAFSSQSLLNHLGPQSTNFQNVVGDIQISSKVSSGNAFWRLVGLVSSVFGLLCYAQSPSFNRLIGRWNIVKFSLYGVFSLAIFTTILFVKQFSPSTKYAQLKTYISFAVLMIISVYSFYYDKAVNGKPEILSLVSNAAFALMSLSLSKLIKFGFEIGIFAYFLGCLVVQLWTINWMLILVAIIFGCPLFVMHSSSHSQDEVDTDQIIDESSGSDPEVGNVGQPDVDVGNEISQVIIESYPDCQKEVSSEGQDIHCSSDSITEVASDGGDLHVDIIHETNSISVVAL